MRQTDGVRRDGDPVHVVARRHRRARQGHRLPLPAAEGGLRAWASGFALPATLEGPKLDAAYEFVNWFLSGWAAPSSTARATIPASVDRKAYMQPYEWAYWMEASRPRRTSSPRRARSSPRRRRARRRLVQRAHGRRRLLERRDGRGRLHGPQVERVRRGVSRGGCRRGAAPAPRQGDMMSPRPLLIW